MSLGPFRIVGAACLLLALATSFDSRAGAPRELIDERLIAAQALDPGATCSGITTSGDASDQHLFFTPPAAQRKPSLVLFLGGSRSNPTQYEEVSRYAARLGYGVLNLAYPTGRGSVGLFCGAVLPSSNACYSDYRGESLYGERVAYREGASQSYGSARLNVSIDDSIVNRLVCAVQFLKRQADVLGNTDDARYFAGLLDTTSAQARVSPYPATSYSAAGPRTPSYPVWSNIIVAGHSQGGGSAAFLAMTLPADTPVKRVVMLSAPNDHIKDSLKGDSAPASWILSSSTTPLDRFFGLRHIDEGSFGDNTQNNWDQLGGLGVGFPHRTREQPVAFDPERDAVIDTETNRLTINVPDTGKAFEHHISTAVDCPSIDQGDACASIRLRTVMPAWNYLFTGGYGSD